MASIKKPLESKVRVRQVLYLFLLSPDAAARIGRISTQP
jgi:hypothetical protein